MNTLIFEGAGWSKAEHNGVGNCRIRTRIRNRDGRLIYLEMGGTKFSKAFKPKWAEGLDFVGRVDSCFYCDAEWDRRRNHSKGLSKYEREHFEYTKENILKFVNEKLNCSFGDMVVINEGLCVHNTEEPLCDCSNGNHEPFKNIEININELDEIEPINTYGNRRNVASYKIDWEYVKELPGIKQWIQGRFEGERKKFEDYHYYAQFRWNENGIITDLIVTAREWDFVHMSFAAEDIETVMEAIKKSNKTTVAI